MKNLDNLSVIPSNGSFQQGIPQEPQNIERQESEQTCPEKTTAKLLLLLSLAAPVPRVRMTMSIQFTRKGSSSHPSHCTTKNHLHQTSEMTEKKNLLHLPRTMFCLVAPQLSQLCSRCVLEGEKPRRRSLNLRWHDFTSTPLLRRERCDAQGGTKALEADRAKITCLHCQLKSGVLTEGWSQAERCTLHRGVQDF